MNPPQSDPSSKGIGAPPSEGSPGHSFNDQMQIMQSLMEIQRELSSLTTKTDRIIIDVDKLDNHVDGLRTKIARFEGISFCAGVLLVIFGVVLWWLVGDQLTEIKNQIQAYQHQQN